MVTCAARRTPHGLGRVWLLQVQKVTPEELEVAIANRDKAILVDFFGEAATEYEPTAMHRVRRRVPIALDRASWHAWMHARDTCAPRSSPRAT
jgi:hypothetical protein